MDEQLAMFVVESHRRSHPSAVKAAATTGTGDEEVEDDNTAIINDKVWCGYVVAAAAVHF